MVFEKLVMHLLIGKKMRNIMIRLIEVTGLDKKVSPLEKTCLYPNSVVL